MKDLVSDCVRKAITIRRIETTIRRRMAHTNNNHDGVDASETHRQLSSSGSSSRSRGGGDDGSTRASANAGTRAANGQFQYWCIIMIGIIVIMLALLLQYRRHHADDRLAAMKSLGLL